MFIRKMIEAVDLAVLNLYVIKDVGFVDIWHEMRHELHEEGGVVPFFKEMYRDTTADSDDLCLKAVYVAMVFSPYSLSTLVASELPQRWFREVKVSY